MKIFRNIISNKLNSYKGLNNEIINLIIENTGLDRIKINDEISVSQDVELIKSILNDDGPEKFLVSFGFTGWSEGQLETEILSGNWLITPSSKEIIFNTPNDQKINKVSKLAGFNLQTVSSNYGSS